MDEAQLARLTEAFSNRCVSAWLGHGDPLFLGFGSDVLPSRIAGERRARPAYGLDTNFATWRIEGPITAQQTDEEPSAEVKPVLRAAAESLIGERVVAWQVLADDIGLRIELTGAKVLTIEPWPTTDGIADAWSLHAPDGQILAVANDGRVVVVPDDLPIRDWF